MTTRYPLVHLSLLVLDTLSLQGQSSVIMEYDPAYDDQPWEDADAAAVVDADALTTEDVLERIEMLVGGILEALDEERLPVLEAFDDGTTAKKLRKEFCLQQARSLTSIVLVLDFCFELLQQRKTTTVREVYYAHVTHFRNQKECDSAIRDAAVLLHVPRHALGLEAAAKGWFCGDVQIIQTDNELGQDVVAWDGRHVWQSSHGSIIGSEWLRPRGDDFTVQTEAAHCILVIEKEGVYRRLAQDRFFDSWPCILVTGKGFPDLATRALVHALHTTLGLPVWGLSDGNPFGVLILHTYAQGSAKRGVDGGDRYSVPIEWIGLRPSQMEGWPQLPPQVFQQLTTLDENRLTKTLLAESGHAWTDVNLERLQELEDMLENGYKMELEALHWLGMDYLSGWLGKIFAYNLQRGVNEPEAEHLAII